MNDKLKLTFNEIDASSLNIIPKCKKVRAGAYLNVKKGNDYYVKFINQKNILWFAVVSNSEKLNSQIRMMPDTEPVRYPEENEDISNLETILNNNPDITNIAKKYYVHPYDVLFIINMRATYNILKNEFGESIPDAKFCIVQEKRLFQKPKIAVVQKKIEGISLWDLFYFDRQNFERNKPVISKLIHKYISNENIDFNIKNFILSPDNKLYYVDSKPSYVNTKRVNEINLKGILEYIIFNGETANSVKFD